MQSFEYVFIFIPMLENTFFSHYIFLSPNRSRFFLFVQPLSGTVIRLISQILGYGVNHLQSTFTAIHSQ